MDPKNFQNFLHLIDKFATFFSTLELPSSRQHQHCLTTNMPVWTRPAQTRAVRCILAKQGRAYPLFWVRDCSLSLSSFTFYVFLPSRVATIIQPYKAALWAKIQTESRRKEKEAEARRISLPCSTFVLQRSVPHTRHIIRTEWPKWIIHN